MASSNPDYLQWALKLSRPSTLIITDNAIQNGTVINADSKDPSIQGIRRFNEILASDPRVIATTIHTVGSKGWDGLAIALVTEAQ